MVRKLLAILIFLLVLLINNECVKGDVVEKKTLYYDSWEMDKVENIAQELLSKSLRKADEEWFLGLFYFYQGDYSNALFYLKNACNKNPQNRKWADFYVFVEKTSEITKDFESYESEHFILRLDKKDNILVDYALDALEEGYQEIGKDLECFPSGKVLVEIYPSSEDFNWASSLSKRDMEVSGAIGICKFNRLMTVSPRCLAFGYRWLDALVHEYTHFVINIKSRGRCPLWLHEGIAKFEEKRWINNSRKNYLIPVYSNLLKEALDKNELISFERMSPSLVKLDTQKEVGLAFAEVASAVDYMVSEYGIEILPQVLEKLKENDNYKEVITEVLNKDYKKFEKEWLEYLKKIKLVITPGVIMESFKVKDKDVDYETEEYLTGQLRDYIRLGDMFRKKDKPQIALEQYKKALELESYNPVVLNRIGKVYFSMGDFMKSEEYFKRAIEMNPNYVSSYTNLGDLYFYQKNFSSALVNYQESNRINPFNPGIHKNMGLIYYANNDNQTALKEWKVTEKLAPRDLEIKGWIMNLKE